jgi:hypothetical protein
MEENGMARNAFDNGHGNTFSIAGIGQSCDETTPDRCKEGS